MDCNLALSYRSFSQGDGLERSVSPLRKEALTPSSDVARQMPRCRLHFAT